MICIVLSYSFPHAFFTCHGPILEAGLHFWMEVWVELSCHGSFMDGCAMYRAASCHFRECRRICWRSNTALYLLAGRTFLAKDGGKSIELSELSTKILINFITDLVKERKLFYIFEVPQQLSNMHEQFV